MATRYSTYTLQASQSPVHSYNRNGQHVTEGYDLNNAKYWYRIGFGQVHEFNSQREMEQARDREFLPSTPDLSLPQLPARALAYSFDARVDRNLRRNRIAFRQNHSKRYPTRGIIALPAPKQPETPQLPAISEHTRRQEQRRASREYSRELAREIARRGRATVLNAPNRWVPRPAIELPAPKPASLASEIETVIASKKAWYAGETVWIASRSAFLKECGGLISLDYIPPRRNKFTPPVPVGKVGVLSRTGGWRLGHGWQEVVKKAERGLGAAS